jgi:formylmethanofuran dehydrogenase subunit E
VSGKAVSAKAQRQNAQLRPIACARCSKRVKDGTGRRVDGKLLCTKCHARQDTSQPPERPA